LPVAFGPALGSSRFQGPNAGKSDEAERSFVMPATPFQDQDPFDPDIQQLYDETEKRIYGETGGAATDGNITGLFHEGFNWPRNSALAHDVLKTDRWKMKGTMVSLADRLGTDHGTISRWYHQGILPPWLENFLMACPDKPADVQSVIDRVFHARHRAALMNVAKYFYGKLPGHSLCDGDSLMEIDAEFLFEILADRSSWETARAALDLSMAARIVRVVCDPPDREILPFWYNKKQSREVTRSISRLRNNNRLAFKYLCLLQRHWEGVFVLTRAVTEGMGWL
jgi:hypothetical protein